MEDAHLAGRPPALFNQAAGASCTGDLTRSNSEASSLTTENSKDILDHKPDATQCECTAMKHEKHNQYLNRLEASFVKQLHRSTGWLGWCSERSKNRNLSANQSSSNNSQQFSVIGNGCWQKIDFGKANTIDSQDFLTSPWVKHFKRAGRLCPAGSANVLEGSKNHYEEKASSDPRTLSLKVRRRSEDLPVNQTRVCNSVGNISEGSGQNFLDEDCKHDSRSQVKRLKTSVAETSVSEDQIVPSREFDAKLNSMVDNIATEERYRSFAIPDPDMELFLRGS